MRYRRCQYRSKDEKGRIVQCKAAAMPGCACCAEHARYVFGRARTMPKAARIATEEDMELAALVMRDVIARHGEREAHKVVGIPLQYAIWIRRKERRGLSPEAPYMAPDWAVLQVIERSNMIDGGSLCRQA